MRLPASVSTWICSSTGASPAALTVPQMPNFAGGGELLPNPWIWRSGARANPPSISFCESSLVHTYQLVENGEFELQLDCINHGLYRSLSNVFIGIFETNQDNVHDDTD